VGQAAIFITALLLNTFLPMMARFGVNRRGAEAEATKCAVRRGHLLDLSGFSVYVTAQIDHPGRPDCRRSSANKGPDLPGWGTDWEIAMDDVAGKIVDILKKHMKEPREDIGLNTALTDLKIESLDLAMIVFDIEDTFGIEIPYNANEEAADFKTVGSVVERVRGLIESSGAAAAKA
jgi:acyl carrier protein/nodulation protein F